MESVRSFFSPITTFFTRNFAQNADTPQVETVDLVANNQLALISAQNEERAHQAIHATNIFPSYEMKERTIEMANVAKLMYADELPLGTLRSVLPSPEAMGIKLPTGLKVQAFRHGDEVIIAIRGTELNKDPLTKFKNVVADPGIGRHKSHEDLNSSLEKVNKTTHSVHGFKIAENHMDAAKSIINTRVIGHTDADRAQHIASRVGVKSLIGAGKGAIGGGTAGSLLAATLFFGGLASGGIVTVIGGIITIIGVATGIAVDGGVETVKCLTAADGYPVLLSYIRACDSYISALKDSGYITKNDNIITVGHSLGGYLAGVVGAMHADEIYSFNGPGVNFDVEMPAIIKNLGLDRNIQENVSYHSFSMESDFIGNLTKRSGDLRTFSVPLPLKDFPYDSPLAFHGIDLMLKVMNLSSVLTIPRPLTFRPQGEEVVDKKTE